MRVVSLFCLTLVWSLAAPSAALAGAASPQDAASAADARGWLMRMQSAARERNYQGTLVFTAGEVVSSSKIGHFCTGDQSFERVEALDGRQQRVYRHNELVHTLWPQSRVATSEQRDAVSATPLLPDVEPRLQEHYELRVLGSDHIAGREAKVLWLKPRDELRFAQRLWADAATGLMLRADVLGPGSIVLESSAFSDIEIGGKPHRESVLGPMNKLEGYRVVKLESTRAQLDAEGWLLSPVPPGFRLVGCLKRPIGTPAAGDPVTAQVLQAVFSDGLTRVSVFIEPYDRAQPRRPLLTQLGATFTLMKPHADRWWITVMGDVPAQTLKQFMGALERRP